MYNIFTTLRLTQTMVKRNIPEVDTFLDTCDLIKVNTRSICHQTGCKKTKLSYGVKGGESISCKIPNAMTGQPASTNDDANSIENLIP